MSSIRSKIVRWALTTGLAFSFCTLHMLGQNPQSTSSYKLCFPRTTTPPNISLGPTDPGWAAEWTGAFTYTMGTPSGTSPAVTLRGIRATDSTVTPQDYLYLSIDAGNLDSTLITPGPPGTFNDYPLTLVVLAFDPGDLSAPGDDAHLQRIHILPVRTNAAYGQPVGPPAKVQYWGYGRNTTTGVYNTPRAEADLGTPTSGSPLWLGNNFKVSYYQDSVNLYHWYLAMKIPVRNDPNPANSPSNPPDPAEKVQVPTTGSFGLYVDVFPVKKDSVGNHDFWPVNWPPNTPRPSCSTTSVCTAMTPVSNCTADCMTPNPTAWGTSPVAGTACGGVSIGSQLNDIFTNNVPNSKICIRPNVSVTSGPDQFSCPATPNIFSATVHNTMVDGSGAGQTATGVRATFFITDWGVTNSWTQIGVVGNPTAFLPVSPGDSTPFQTSPWVVPNPDNFDPTKPNSHPHQCVRVQLDSAPGSNAVFLNSVAQRNMDFVNASRFQRNADISAKGYPPRLKPDGTAETDQFFDLRVTMHQEVLNPGTLRTGPNPAGTTSSLEKKGQFVSQLTWQLEACRHTGRYMAVENHKLEFCEPVGAFGYVVRHVGNAPVERWRVKLTGIGLGSSTENVYPLHISQDGVATVNTRIEPEESGTGKFAVFLDVGAGIPHGTFGNFFNTGFSLNTGLEYIATSHFSVEGIFGYHRFPAKITGDLNLYQFSVNGKAYLTSGTLRPFVDGGVGAYKFSPGPTKFGGNVGGGVLYSLTSRVGLEGVYNFHVINTPGAATKFSTLQGGIRFVF